MTVDLPPHATAPESLAWTYWASHGDAADALGYPVARLSGSPPVAIGSPVTEGHTPLHIWLRYHDEDGRASGVVTLPWPTDLTMDFSKGGSSELAVARAVTAMLHGTAAPESVEVPADTRGSICLAVIIWGSKYYVDHAVLRQ